MKKVEKSDSWKRKGGYSFAKLSKENLDVLRDFIFSGSE